MLSSPPSPRVDIEEACNTRIQRQVGRVHFSRLHFSHLALRLQSSARRGANPTSGQMCGQIPHIYSPWPTTPPRLLFSFHLFIFLPFLFVFSSFCLFCLSFHLFCLFAFLFVLLFNLSSVRVTALPGLPFRDPTFCRDVRYICIFSQLLHACTIQIFIHIRFEHN